MDNTNIKKSVYFMGIGGTGMAATAGLCQEAGFDVSGSDMNIYPPMSELLEELNIKVKTPYRPENLDHQSPDIVVIANALSRGHPELEEAIKKKLNISSFPALIEEHFLANKEPIVIAGTHGKTTTSSYVAHVLEELGEKPSFLIGGIPKNFPRSFRLTKGQYFVLEGDEYDTSYFDKAPKFLHYKPSWAIVNNIEFDHADIYQSLQEISERFKELLRLVAKPERIIVNSDDKNILKCLEDLDIRDKVTTTSIKKGNDADVQLLNYQANPTHWTVEFETKSFGRLQLDTTLTGMHNLSNTAQVLALVDKINLNNISKKSLVEAFKTFQGVSRRLELLSETKGVSIYEDFAHHPTAVSSVINGFRQSHPKKRILVAFEPRNATSRRNIFAKQFAKALGKADLVYIGCCPDDNRIAEEEKMNTEQLAKNIGSKAKAFRTNEDLLSRVAKDLKIGDAIIFMSCGSFSGIQHKLSEAIDS